MSFVSTLSRHASQLGLASVPWYAWGLAGLAAIVLGSRKASGAPPAPGATPAPKPPGPAPLLKKGSKGPWVSYLQSLLGVQQTASFDDATDASVKAYQKSKGLLVDGVVGKDTWGALGVATAGSAPKPPSGGGGGSVSPGTPPPQVQPGDTFSLPPPMPGGGGVLADDIGQREAQILAAISAGDVDHQWRDVAWQADGHTVKVKVSRRPLALTGSWAAASANPKTGVVPSTTRLVPSVTYKTAQKIADMFGALLLTTKVSDEQYKSADLKLPPTTQPWSQDNSMEKTYRMIEQSNRLAKEVGSHTGSTANEGKDWIISRRMWTDPPSTVHNGPNFGWYPGGSKSPGGASVIQSVGMTHGMNHADYSQLVRLMLPTVEIDGVPHGIAEVLADPSRSHLLQDEGGTFPKPRHPDL